MDTRSDPEKELPNSSGLLQCFAASGDEAAFEGLVRKYAAMVRGVAMRRTGDATLADEVTQTVFTLLARRAASIPSDHLGGWLHHAASFTAGSLRRNSLRYRRALEELSRHIPADMPHPGTDPVIQGSPWADIRPHLDEAVSRLPMNSRLPVIMRFFESRSVREIAALTGKNEKTVRKSLERSLQRLSGILRRRGITTTGAALAGTLSVESLLAPPASAAGLIAAALGGASAAAVSGGSLLSRTIISMTGTHKAAITAAVILATVPAAFLWKKNAALHREMRGLKAGAAHSSLAFPRQRPAPGGSGIIPKLTEAGEKPAPSPRDTREVDLPAGDEDRALTPGEIRDLETDRAFVGPLAAAEMERISLYLPDLMDTQRERALAALESSGYEKLNHMVKALKSGAFARVKNTPEKATAMDKALMAVAAPSTPEPPENDPLFPILDREQFGLHWRKREEQRASDVEADIASTLGTLNAVMHLSRKQEDRIFDELVGLQLAPVETGDGQPGNAYLDRRVRDAEKERIIRENLNPEQADVFDRTIARSGTPSAPSP